MPLSPHAIHQRYVQQAKWTSDLRAHLLERAEFAKAKRVLEVGSGTGAVLSQWPLREDQEIHGLDIDFASLQFARAIGTRGRLMGGSALALPYPDNSFDLTYCHFVLLWLENPLRALAEMRRVTKTGGRVLALAEPDYGGRIDFPQKLEMLGKLQAEALRKQGAEPEIGRQLRGLFRESKFGQVESGVMGAQWRQDDLRENELEAKVLQSDLVAILSPEQTKDLMVEERKAQSTGARILYVPTFYAWGIVK
jgi:SAM-dependent methyltransferase